MRKKKRSRRSKKASTQLSDSGIIKPVKIPKVKKLEWIKLKDEFTAICFKEVSKITPFDKEETDLEQVVNENTPNLIELLKYRPSSTVIMVGFMPVLNIKF